MSAESEEARIAQVERSFIDGSERLVRPGRFLVKEGLLAKICRKMPKRRYFFLFNDILVYGVVVSLQKRAFAKQVILPLEDIEVVLLPEDTLRNGFEIGSRTKSFHVFASSATDRDAWLEEFTRLGRRRNSVADQPQSNGAPKFKAAVWVPDYQVEQCMVCKYTRFTVFNRRHHCRSCGCVVCAACSENKMVVKNLSDKKVRVCNNCFSGAVQPAEATGSPTAAPTTPSRSTRNADHDDDDDDDDDDDHDDDDHDDVKYHKLASNATESEREPSSTESRHRYRPLPQPPPSHRIGVCEATVILDYNPSPYDQDALSLIAGERITILERNETGLWKAMRQRDRKVGTIPFRYLEKING